MKMLPIAILSFIAGLLIAELFWAAYFLGEAHVAFLVQQIRYAFDF